VGRELAFIIVIDGALRWTIGVNISRYSAHCIAGARSVRSSAIPELLALDIWHGLVDHVACTV
jgi:hypothetical protein